MRLITINRD